MCSGLRHLCIWSCNLQGAEGRSEGESSESDSKSSGDATTGGKAGDEPSDSVTAPDSPEAPPTPPSAPPTPTDHVPSESQTSVPTSPPSPPPPTHPEGCEPSAPTAAPVSPPSIKKPTIAIPRVPSGQSSLATLSTLASKTSSDSLNLLILSSENEEDLLSGQTGLTRSTSDTLAALGVATPPSSVGGEGELFLVDSTEMLAEEKEVGAEIPKSEEDGLTESVASIAEDLEKSLNASKLVGGTCTHALASSPGLPRLFVAASDVQSRNEKPG